MKSLAVAICLVAAPGLAAAQEEWGGWRLDHRNQPAVLVGPAFENLIVTAADDDQARSEPGGLVDLAFGLPVTDEGGELYLGLRVGGGGGERRLVAPHLFYRAYAGHEAWKTYFDAGALLRIEPLVAVAARIGLGVQYDFHENWGAYLGAGGSLGYGQGLQVGLDAGAGVQFRFGTAG